MKDFPNAGSGVPDETPFWTGKTLGRYAVGERLGRGGMGEVYEARDPDLNRAVAIKTLAPDYAHRQSVEALVREAKAASALNHPNILTVYEVVREGPTVAIVMEKIEGEPLSARRGSPVPVAAAVRIARQAAEALTSAHAAGLVHRDIKPENIMVRKDGIVKVVDFGLARQHGTGSSLSPGTAAGTLRYMSPEQALGEDAVAASDTFSLGMVMHEIIGGRHPFEADSTFDVLHGIGTQHAAKLGARIKGFPPELDQLLARMMDKEPQARPKMQAVAAELARIEGRMTLGHEGPPAWLWPAAAVLVAVGALGLWVNRPKEAVSREYRQLTTTDAENRVTAAAISGDGKQLVFADITGVLQVRTFETNVTRPLLAPAKLTVERISWFPDRSRLLVSAHPLEGGVSSLWIVSLDGGEPSLLQDRAQDGSVSPDGSKYVFTSTDGHEIWIGEMRSGAEPRRLLKGEGTMTFPLAIWSADGKRIICQRLRYAPRAEPLSAEPALTLDKDYRRVYESIDAATGKVTATGEVAMTSASALADGRIVFLWIDASGPFSLNLWEVETDRATGALRGPPRQLTHYTERALDNLSATTDGRKICAVHSVSQPDIYVAEMAAAPPRLIHKRRLTLDQKADYPHGWSADGKTVFFESSRNGSWDIFRQRIGERNAELVAGTPREEFNSVLSPDGKWLLFFSGAPGASGSDWRLQRVPANGGPPETIEIAGPPIDYFDCTPPDGGRCIVRTTENREYVFYELDPVKGRGRKLARMPWMPGAMGDWALSADGTQVAVPNHESIERLVKVVSLEGGGIYTIRIDPRLPGIIGGVHTAGDGKGWLVSLRREIEFYRSVARLRVDIVYLNRDGSGVVLHESPITTWAVASPGGERVAFVDGTMTGNVVLWER